MLIFPILVLGAVGVLIAVQISKSARPGVSTQSSLIFSVLSFLPLLISLLLFTVPDRFVFSSEPLENTLVLMSFMVLFPLLASICTPIAVGLLVRGIKT